MNKYNDLRQNLIIFDFALKMQKRTFERIADGNLDSYGRWMKTNFGINKKDHGDIVFDAKKMEGRKLHSMPYRDQKVVLALFDEEVTLVHSSAAVGRLSLFSKRQLTDNEHANTETNTQAFYQVEPYTPYLINRHFAFGIMKHPKQYNMITANIDWSMREWLEYILAMGQQQ